MNKNIIIAAWAAVIAVFAFCPLLGDTPTSTDEKEKKAQELYAQGMKHYYGSGALQDYSRAFKLLKEAADLGNLEACGKVADMYCFGDGCEANSATSFKYAEKAKFESENARFVLGILNYFGFISDAGERIQDYPKAYAFFSESPNWYLARFFKGLMEYHGVGTEKNQEKAADTFYSCCGEMPKGNLPAGRAAICLAHMYANGEGVGINRAEARKWYKYGLKTSYPNLVTEAKKPLTERDVAIWRNDTGGNTITITPFDWRMAKLIGDEGKWGRGRTKWISSIGHLPFLSSQM